MQLNHKQNLMEQIFIPKDEEKCKSFLNARPITKTAPVYKILDTILNERLKKDLNPGGKFRLSQDQIGFREGMGCELNILRLAETLKWRIKSGMKENWVLFIDLKSAFDKVNHDYLFEKLEELEVNGQLINTIKWLYRDTRIRVGEEDVRIGSSVF